MADYWVTFRLAADTGYQKRYDALLKAMTEARSGASWGEPTSFWLVQSSLSLSAFVQKLASGLNPKTDMLVVRQLAVNDAGYFGTIEHLSILKTFLPDIKKIG